MDNKNIILVTIAISGSFHFSVTSMDEIDFPNETFDLVMTSMALHEAKPEVRRIAIRKACCSAEIGRASCRERV